MRLNIKKYRESMNISQYKLAELMGVSQSTIGMWESGKNKPEHSNIIKLSEILGVSIGNLYDGEGSANKSTKVPVLGHIPAGIPIEAIEDILDYEDIPLEWTTGEREYFALKIQGNSMFPKYLEDDIVIFQKAVDCESGEDCAVMVNGDDATFKKVKKQLDGIVLQPLNTTDYDPQFFSEKDVETIPVRILGIAREIRRKVSSPEHSSVTFPNKRQFGIPKRPLNDSYRAARKFSDKYTEDNDKK